MMDHPNIRPQRAFNVNETRDPREILNHCKLVADDVLRVFQDPNKEGLNPEHTDILVRVMCRNLMRHFTRMESILESQNPTTNA